MKLKHIKILFLALISFIPRVVNAGPISNLTPLPVNQSNEYKDAIENINISIERLENNIATLTDENEKQVHNQNNIKKEITNILSDFKLQLNELYKKQNELDETIKLHKLEIENLKNITSMLMDKNKLNEKNLKIKETATIATSAPDSLLINKTKNTEKTSDTLQEKNNQKDEIAFKEAMLLFNKKEYINAIIKFGSNLKEFENGKNFYNNLLHLAISFKEINNNDNACTAFNKIIVSSDNIDINIKNKATEEAKKLNCKK